MDEPTPPNPELLQSCPDCGAVLDVTETAPFSNINCPVCGTSMRTRTQFNNFSLQTQLGAGGMGAVYKALDTKLNRLVALKVVLKEYSSDPAYLGKFEHEARITASVNHPHVVKVFSFGSAHGLFYIAMELVDKGSLDDLINLQGRVGETQVLEVGVQIAQGLQAAFQRGLIHRDVKPGNILFADAHTAKIVDFGLALPLEQGHNTAGGEVWGTPYYIAPEKLNHEPEDFRSDIYSLGGTLFHALAGRPPFEAETASLVALRHLKSQAVSLQAFAPDISSATAFVINRTLRKDPKDRYQSYDELIEHLNYAHAKLLEDASKPRQQKSRVVLESQQQQKVMAWITLALVVTLLTVGGVLFAFRDKIFKKDDSYVPDSGKATAVASSAVEAQYADARKRLLGGDYEGAQKAFQALAGEKDIPHPLDRWVLVQEGLSALFAGHLQDAQDVFKSLQQEGPYSTAPEDKMLANFFMAVGRIGQQQSIPSTVVKQYDPESCEAMGMLVFAMNDWDTGQYDDAARLFHAFLNSTPKPPCDWIADYKPLIKKYVPAADAYGKVADAIKAANTGQKQQDALKDLQAYKATISGPRVLVDQVARIEADLREKMAKTAKSIADQQAEEQRGQAELQKKQAEEQAHAAQLAGQKENEAKAVGTIRTAYKAALRTYQFDEVVNIITKTEVSDSGFATEKSTLLKKAQWLDQFKETLINDINAAGYPLPIAKPNSFPIQGGTHKANALQIEVQNQYGAVTIFWRDLPPAQLLGMAEYFDRKVTAADPGADRAWVAGVFAAETGLAKEGKALMDQAVQGKPAYKDDMALFPDQVQ